MMRKADKKRAEGSVQILKNLHTIIRRMMNGGNGAETLKLLEQCQTEAIGLGEMIEAVEGEGTSAVTALEEYCELVYEIYQNLWETWWGSSDRVYNLLAQKTVRIEKSIRNDIRVRTEAVFLPYKASMWDSLESIWKAADEDPDCDAYVVPIPYYDKRPDGSPGRMHYEGDQYPENVPVVDYQSYDIAKRHPDLIVIHNPYDDCNSVTSVLPSCYASRLKQYTEKLVYVPYFVLEEVDPDDEQALENISHFCILPGVIHAHQVIVQSENMRQAYIKILTGEFGERTRKYWENKILGLGSPKTDRVLEAKQKEQELPKEWMKILRKSDGSRKKVVLYNTSVTALLRYEGKMLEKMKDVFRVLKGKRDDVALLWRPHPLIRATIESLHPQLWDAYRDMTEQYKREGWGIYDDTADVDRAIALSDAYYGDGSSVVQLCRSVGLPVMIQDVEVLEEHK